MDGDDLARAAYLGLLLVAVGGYFLVENRARLGQMARFAALWGLIFVGAIAAIGLWDDIAGDVNPKQASFAGGRVDVPVAPDGHFYLILSLDGTDVRFMIDTGASDMVLTERDAQRIGINTETLAYFGRAQTANGTVATAPVRIGTVKLGEILDTDIPAQVNGGDLDISLLGMSYLRRFEKLEIAGKTLSLVR